MYWGVGHDRLGWNLVSNVKITMKKQLIIGFITFRFRRVGSGFLGLFGTFSTRFLVTLLVVPTIGRFPWISAVVSVATLGLVLGAWTWARVRTTLGTWVVITISFSDSLRNNCLCKDGRTLGSVTENTSQFLVSTKDSLGLLILQFVRTALPDNW